MRLVSNQLSATLQTKSSTQRSHLELTSPFHEKHTFAIWPEVRNAMLSFFLSSAWNELCCKQAAAVPWRYWSKLGRIDMWTFSVAVVRKKNQSSFSFLSDMHKPNQYIMILSDCAKWSKWRNFPKANLAQLTCVCSSNTIVFIDKPTTSLVGGWTFTGHRDCKLLFFKYNWTFYQRETHQIFWTFG